MTTQWYQDAIIYEVHVRAFFDSVGDGYGDFGGLAQKLDYLHDLGVTAIWLLPFYPSPLRDDGYDIADYTSIHSQYGTLETFREFLDGAHARGLQVITELVLNHTSDQHPWFQRARRAPSGSTARDFYVWSPTPEKYRDARIIFKDFEVSNWTYDHVAQAYYWHRFYSHQPDLNFDNPDVWKAIFPVVDFWLEMGVDGLRLDAVPYLFEREGTNCENLPETHEFLKALRRHVDERFPNRMLLAEANQWPEDAVAYFGAGDECHMAFHFPLMPRLFMAVQREDRFPIIDIMDQTPDIPPACQWALFLRNHDELTLEMVTDEERDYMYRVYARDSRARINLGIRHRLAPLMGNSRRRVELMNSLLFSLPGAPVVYYGDEIGMGDNIYLGDRNGVRTPMQWSSDRNAGFSRANPQKLFLPVTIDPEYHYESVNVEAQQNNPQSLLWWMKRLIDVRRRHPALSRGTLELLHPENRRVLAFLRVHEDERLLIVANLSRYVQYVELDLSRFQGMTPIELFGRTPFPPVGDLPYLLTLGPHSFYWFMLAPAQVGHGAPPGGVSIPGVPIPEIRASGGWERLFHEDAEVLEVALPSFLDRRWSRPADEAVKRAWLVDAAPMAVGERTAQAALIEFESSAGGRTSTIAWISIATGTDARNLLELHSHRVIARVGDSVLYDAATDSDVAAAMLDAFRMGRNLATREEGRLEFRNLPALRPLLEAGDEPLAPAGVKIEQFNTSIAYGNRLILKIYRQFEDGPNPEVELGRFLAEGGRFTHSPAVVGTLEYRRPPAHGPRSTVHGPRAVCGVLHTFEPFESDAWQRTLDELSDFFQRVLAQPEPPPEEFPRPAALPKGIGETPPPVVAALLDDYLAEPALLGRRTAELHAALASESEDPEFAPEAFTGFSQRSVYQSMRTLRLDVFDRLRRRLSNSAPGTHDRASALLARGDELMRSFRVLLGGRLDAVRIRCHRDYHLSQVLHTGKDYVIIDFEGPVHIPLGERRIKRSPLLDVASMLASFDFAAQMSLLGIQSGRGRTPGSIRSEDVVRLAPWCRCWTGWTSAAFVNGYLEACGTLAFTPASPTSFGLLLRAFLVAQGLTDLDQAMRSHPELVEVRLVSLMSTLDDLGERGPWTVDRGP